MECESMLLVKNDVPYLWDLSNSFSNTFIDFYNCAGFHQMIYQEEWSTKLRVENGGSHESLNLLHVSRCEMLHFVTSYMKQHKSCKQILESAQYGLEISFKEILDPQKHTFSIKSIKVHRRALVLILCLVPYHRYEKSARESCNSHHLFTQRDNIHNRACETCVDQRGYMTSK